MVRPRTRLDLAALLPVMFVAALCLCLPVLSHAQDLPANGEAKAPGVTRDLLIEQLGSDDHAERAAASRRLLGEIDLALGEHAKRYLLAPARRADAELDAIINDLGKQFRDASTPEQRHRLLDIARHHFVQLLRLKTWPGPRAGALGVIQAAVLPDRSPEPLRRAIKQAYDIQNVPVIRVVNTLPGFPAYAYLEPGDIIVRIDGNTLVAAGVGQEVSSQFGNLILDKRQNDTMRFTVWRNGKLMPVSVKLASSDAIRNLYEPTDSRLMVQYRVKWWQFRDRIVSRAKGEPLLRIDLGRPSEPGDD